MRPKRIKFPPAPALPTSNSTTAHPPTNHTPTHTLLLTSDLVRLLLPTCAQLKFHTSTLGNLKRSEDVRLFLFPIDIVVTSNPCYPEVVAHPMDFSATKEKLNSSHAKPGLNPDKLQGQTINQSTADTQLAFTSFVKLNSSECATPLMGG